MPLAPSISSISPSQGPSSGNTSVTITGANFQSGATVTFDGNSVTSSITSTSITCNTPSHSPGAVQVQVTNPDSQYDVLYSGFTYLAPPTISNIMPNQGPTSGSSSVVIYGADFQTGATVTFDGISATASVGSSSSITCNAPSHAAGAVDVRVVNPDGQYALATAGFQYVPPPTISSVTPSTGPAAGGTSVTISGADFQSGATVQFDGSSTSCTVSSGSITCTSPTHIAALVDVRVTNPDGQAAVSLGGFLYV